MLQSLIWKMPVVEIVNEIMVDAAKRGAVIYTLTLYQNIWKFVLESMDY